MDERKEAVQFVGGLFIVASLLVGFGYLAKAVMSSEDRTIRLNEKAWSCSKYQDETMFTLFAGAPSSVTNVVCVQYTKKQ